MMSSHVETKTSFVPSFVGMRASRPLSIAPAVSESIATSEPLRVVLRGEREQRRGRGREILLSLDFPLLSYMRKPSSCDRINSRSLC